MEITQLTSFQARIPVGTLVEWKEEIYRMPYAKRPIVTGVVVEHVAGGMTKVRRDDRGSIVTGNALVFSAIA